MKNIQFQGALGEMPKDLRMLVLCFVLLLNIGFFTGFNFVKVTSTFKTNGIERNYLGNEEDEEADVMQFKKSEKEILTLVHNHILSLSTIFFLLSLLLYTTTVVGFLRSFLLFEPFVSLLLTFGGIYVLWLGVTWFKYIIMFSGLAMVISILLMSYYIVRDCLRPKRQ